MCITVGKLSFDDWPMFTWSLGWTGCLPPLVPERISLARPAITSLAFMLVWVPEPVCQTTSGKWSISLPSATSCAAWQIASASLASSTPSADQHIALQADRGHADNMQVLRPPPDQRPDDRHRAAGIIRRPGDRKSTR